MIRILTGDAIDQLQMLADQSVHCCVTSPPYWGLRDYGTAEWEGGDDDCKHIGRVERLAPPGTDKQASNRGTVSVKSGDCACGATRKDRQMGLEPTIGEYVAGMVEVFREVRRVLRDDGTLWLNLGDSYFGTGKGPTPPTGLHGSNGTPYPIKGVYVHETLKQKDLCGIPWRVAFALQADGWYLRQDIIWCLSGGAWLYARTPSGVGPAMLKDLVRLKPGTVELWTGERWTRVTHWTRRNGRADAVELVLRSGERIGCTSNHVWPTARGNVRTDELRIGDDIATTRLPSSGDVAGWLTEDALWFAGIYLAEGSRSGTTIQIAGHIKEATRWPNKSSVVFMQTS